MTPAQHFALPMTLREFVAGLQETMLLPRELLEAAEYRGEWLVTEFQLRSDLVQAARWSKYWVASKTGSHPQPKRPSEFPVMSVVLGIRMELADRVYDDTFRWELKAKEPTQCRSQTT